MTIMSLICFALRKNKSIYKEWDSVFEDWNPTTPEKYPFTSSTEGDFYITHCVFEDKYI